MTSTKKKQLSSTKIHILEPNDNIKFTCNFIFSCDLYFLNWKIRMYMMGMVN